MNSTRSNSETTEVRTQAERAEQLVKLMASFKDPLECSCHWDELELFAALIDDAKEIYGDLHEDFEGDDEPEDLPHHSEKFRSTAFVESFQ